MARKYILNNKNIRIYVCCASCRYKDYNKTTKNGTPYRVCEKHKVEIESYDECDDWEIAENVMNEGGLNRIRKPI